MIGAWFDCRAVDEFADAAIADLVKRVPPASLAAPAKNKAKRLKSTNDQKIARAERFARGEPLNIYKKARLGNRVKWGLREAGYPEDFVDALTYELVTLVALAASARNRK